MYKLVIEDDEGKTTTVPLIRDEITIGRKEGNTIRLTERNVSREHAKLVKDDDKIFLEDVASRYGTRYNGEKLTDRVQFSESDVVMIGNYRLSLQVDRKAAKPKAVSVPKSPEATRQTAAMASTPPADLPVDKAGRLVVISSNYAGKEFPLTKAEMVIGRTEGDIRIDHRSISRNHAKIVRDDGRYKIIDLRSSNGVRVNNEEYRSVHLKKGDIIELGHVRFRYVAPGEAFRFVPEPSMPDPGGPDAAPTSGGGMGKVMLGLAAAGGLVVVLLVVAFVVIGMGGDKTKDGPDKGKGGEVAATDNDANTKANGGSNGGEAAVEENAEVAELLKKAEDAVSAEEWERAIVYLDDALKLAPNNERANEKKSLATREKGMKRFYEQGKAELDKNDFNAAMESFNKIPEGLSIYHQKLKDEGLLQKATDGIVAQHIEDAEYAIERREWNTARQGLSVVLKYDPQNAQAKALLAKINKEASALAEKRDEKNNNDTPPDKNNKNDANNKTNNTTQQPPPGNTGDRKAQMAEKLKEARAAGARGQNQQAIQLALEAKKLGAGASADIVLGQSYEKMGNTGSAITHYNAWLRANGSSKLADSVRAKVTRMGGTPAN